MHTDIFCPISFDFIPFFKIFFPNSVNLFHDPPTVKIHNMKNTD